MGVVVTILCVHHMVQQKDPHISAPSAAVAGAPAIS
jgi:hypothetical protein